MKKIILCLFINTLCILSYSQSIYIENRNYKGYIFPKDYQVYGFPPNPNNFTPSKEDVEDAELILRDYFKKRSFTSCSECPSINRKTLKNYFRQYAGEFAENGNKIIFINFIHKEEKDIVSLEDMKKDIIFIHDGDTCFWKIYIDITSKKVVEIVVNEIAR